MFNFDLKTILFRAIILVIAFTVHEYMHAYVAFRLGDTTARDAGRLTLNPLVHLDIFGSLMLLLVGFGWAKPVPVDPYALRRRTPAGLMLVSVAGPLSNLVLAILGGLIVRLFIAFRLSFIPPMWLLEFINQFIIVNIMLFLFNLIPIAPLDGDKVLEYAIPDSWQAGFQKFRQYGPIILMVIMISGRFTKVSLFGLLLEGPMSKIYQLLTGIPF